MEGDASQKKKALPIKVNDLLISRLIESVRSTMMSTATATASQDEILKSRFEIDLKEIAKVRKRSRGSRRLKKKKQRRLENKKMKQELKETFDTFDDASSAQFLELPQSVAEVEVEPEDDFESPAFLASLTPMIVPDPDGDNDNPYYDEPPRILFRLGSHYSCPRQSS